jgi:phospholipid-binding lipoprotein MlaA
VRRYPGYPLAVAFAIACALGLASCATVGASGAAGRVARAPGDPLEGLNRPLFGFGQALDHGLVRPLVQGYQHSPGLLRRALHNVLQNADEPLVLLNDVMQGRLGTAARTAVRFVSNSTLGVAGLFDPATSAGLPHHDNDFGMTLGRYGFGPGAYVYVPVLGPTSVRDAIGAGVDFVADPLAWVRIRDAKTINLARTSLSLIDDRVEAEDDLLSLEAGAADPYATLRSVYLQSRAAAIKGEDAGLEPVPDLPSPPAPAPSSPEPQS